MSPHAEQGTPNTVGGEFKFTRISKGTGTRWERFWCRLRGGHIPGEQVPAWFKGGGRICSRCGGLTPEEQLRSALKEVGE